jgi:hypothetical protein
LWLAWSLLDRFAPNTKTISQQVYPTRGHFQDYLPLDLKIKDSVPRRAIVLH